VRRVRRRSSLRSSKPSLALAYERARLLSACVGGCARGRLEHATMVCIREPEDDSIFNTKKIS
ncbi:MAG: hypothetical protein FWD63_08000, partial [Propionibacteriaceae bacterium]|nr:hypothetical protein [Propionibacteriaceae bacterium]